MTVERPTTEKEVLEMSKNYNFYTWSPQKNGPGTYCGQIRRRLLFL